MSQASVLVTARRPAWDLAVLSLVSVYLVLFFIPSHIDSGDSLGLAPDLLPKMSALTMGVLSLIGFIYSCRSSVEKAQGNPAARLRPILSIILLCTLAVVFISYWGFSVGALYLIPTLLRLLGEKRWLPILGTTVVCASLLWFIAP
ncbi:tripartite tricarboxylate transporter TctB family protein [Alcaligenes endophyticus]|uniref:Tripartite tricarboxylate transporter TctB family protein n=1 Tax=Alcaligenes endophyticus TaxID=1929088 RepID=A0ABT8EMI9_9BURK|nr:tripartite tricarboxylate transporter TctB family protein [Alcaligenes endophyticus]MCX5590950.1 tripartite tricarboxylate transporter TctB family protein [Alcaligenes endophyticus]MDN4122473.1 tripartite tricarboxylate transporter TctB family protein [Alcaligenes endophyticus]